MSQDTLSKPSQKARTAPRYRVLLLNDDYTPMDFVLFILMRFFRKSDSEATSIMLEAHQKGVALAGIYSFEIAETKLAQVRASAERAGHPLQLRLEPETS